MPPGVGAIEVKGIAREETAAPQLGKDKEGTVGDRDVEPVDGEDVGRAVVSRPVVGGQVEVDRDKGVRVGREAVAVAFHDGVSAGALRRPRGSRSGRRRSRR